jgi:hypothetical protein
MNAKSKNWDEPVLKEAKRQEALQPALLAASSFAANSIAASILAATRFNDPIHKFKLWH